MRIEQATLKDWEAIRQIYIEGIKTKNATFEMVENVPHDGRFWFEKKVTNSIIKASGENGRLLGWACLSPTSSRAVYRGVAEVSVYVAKEAWGQGIGGALLTHLVTLSESMGVWTLQASIFPENESSIYLHQKAGFRIVGRREKIAQQDGHWRDTVLMERRSSVGI